MLIQGFKIGHAVDQELLSGVTVVIPDRPATAAVHVMGGAPGTRDTDLLSPEQLVQEVDAVVLSGGSAYGLDAASGVQAWLREQGRGYPVGEFRIPIVPSAILYDLGNGGDKGWGRYPPYRELAFEAANNLSASPAIGSVGAGIGATVAGGRGGLGIASEDLSHESATSNISVCSVVACNAVGSVHIAETEHFWAAPFEKNSEFGGRGFPNPMPEDADLIITKGSSSQKSSDKSQAGKNTTLAIVMTNAKLSQAQCKRMAINAHDGFARAIYPVHTPSDGDIVFVLSSNEVELEDTGIEPIHIYTVAANTVARAIARGVYEANL
ncbi:MAG: P1 family peptidase [Pseudomonadales bacterium]|jgi:L-aminopeptidase/D-esterase-like protein